MTSAARPDDPGSPSRAGWPMRLLRALRQMNSEQVELWERWVRAQRPWEADWMHWVRDADGEWHLQGNVVPPRANRGGPPEQV